MHAPPGMKAGELCIREVITVEPDELVADAARRMRDEGVGDLVVVERSDGIARPVGIVTDRDLVTRGLARADADAAKLRVREVVSGPPITAAEDDDVDQVLGLLTRHAIRRIPVVDRQGGLQGILTLDDLVGWITEQLDTAAHLVNRQAWRARHARR